MMNLHTTISDQLLQMKDCKVNLYQMTEDDIAQSQSTTATEKEPVSEWMDCRVEADIDGDYTEILTVTVEDLSTLGFQVINNELTSYDNVQPGKSTDTSKLWQVTLLPKDMLHIFFYNYEFNCTLNRQWCGELQL